MNIPAPGEHPDDTKNIISDVFQSLQPLSESFAADFSDLKQPQQSLLLHALLFAVSSNNLMSTTNERSEFAFSYAYYSHDSFIR